MMMVAGILLLCSSQMTWINGQLPANTGFGRLLSSAIHSLSGGSVTLDVELLNSIHMAPVIFILAIVLLVSATLGSKLVGLVGTLLVVLIVYLWLSYNSFSPGDIFGRFGQLGMGTQLAMGSALLSLLATLCPALHLPGRRLDS
jgi:hypothetical protein